VALQLAVRGESAEVVELMAGCIG